nr:hypothetical protein [Mycolicibacterium brisbanense]
MTGLVGFVSVPDAAAPPVGPLSRVSSRVFVVVEDRSGLVPCLCGACLGPWSVVALAWLDVVPDESDVPGSAHATACPLAPAMPMPTATTASP